MGASNCPETPRQRMIGMMYLVLTALLALNVSKEILDAFIVVNESLEKTNENFQKKVDGTYAAFEKQLAINKAKVEPFYKKALEARKQASEMIAFIEQVKNEVVAAEEGITPEEAGTLSLRNVNAKDKYDQSTYYFFKGSQDGAAGKSKELKDKLAGYRKAMLELIDAGGSRNRLDTTIGLELEEDYTDSDGAKQNWEQHNFYHTILAANVVILNKLIAEVKNVEIDIVSQLYSSVSEEDYKFDKIGAKIVPKSTFVLTGESFEADIFVAAYDTKQNPEIIIGSSVDTNTLVVSGETMKVEGFEGVGKLKMAAGGVGLRTYGGVINVPTPSGGVKSYPFSGEYIVAQPSATISPTKMNVFYIGVDNPVSISVPGVANDQVRVSINGGGGTITKTGNGVYVVKVSSVTESCKVQVSADFNGSTRSMGGMDFRVKRVPDPAAYIAGTKGGPIGKGALVAAGAVIPKMENFDFDLNFVITSFTLSMSYQGDFRSIPTSGNRLNAEMINMINKSGRGQKIYIEDIKAKGPDGSSRTLAPINLTII